MRGGISQRQLRPFVWVLAPISIQLPIDLQMLKSVRKGKLMILRPWWDGWSLQTAQSVSYFLFCVFQQHISPTFKQNRAQGCQWWFRLLWNSEPAAFSAPAVTQKLPAGFWSHLLFKTSLYHWPAPSTAVTNNQESSTPSPQTKFWQVKAKNRLHSECTLMPPRKIHSNERVWNVVITCMLLTWQVSMYEFISYIDLFQVVIT